jgi:hypothetical protein
VLEDSGLVIREPDMFKDNRTSFRIAEPLVSFYHAVMRPIWSDLEHTREAAHLWQRSRQRFASGVLGPHFEHLCRSWTRHMAPVDLLGDHPNLVGSGTVNDPANRTSHQVDVVAYGLTDDNRRPLIGLGEVKWGETMGLAHLDRLRRIRALLTALGRPGAAHARLLCFSSAGFSPQLVAAAADDRDLTLVDVARLYQRE